jgi:putative lysine transport system permease protein
MLFIIYPQAIKNALPGIMNEFIVNVKDSAVLFVIGLVDLYTTGIQIYNRNFDFRILIIIGIIYLIITSLATLALHLYEKYQKNKGLNIVSRKSMLGFIRRRKT